MNQPIKWLKTRFCNWAKIPEDTTYFLAHGTMFMEDEDTPTSLKLVDGDIISVVGDKSLNQSDFKSPA